MLEKFYEFLEYNGFDKNDIYMQKFDRLTIISFAQNTDNIGPVYISMGFHDDSEAVDICVLKEMQEADNIIVLKKMNQLNQDFSGITFFATNDSIAVKIFIENNYIFDYLIEKLMFAISVAEQEFYNF